MRNLFLFIVLAMFSTGLHAQTTISSSYTFIQSNVTTLSWPITINGGNSASPVVVTLSEDILLDQAYQYFIIESDYITFEGNNKTITQTFLMEYPGLIQNGSQSSSGYDHVAVNNLHMSSTASLASEAGWIGQSYFGNNASNVIIRNCFTDGSISNLGGGITGTYSSCTVNGSHSSGYISDNSGGIFGAYSYGTAINCYSTGDIYMYGGGIYGYNSFGTVTNCYSTGPIDSYAGGIFGASSYGNVTNSYSRGNIAAYGGGIAGDWFSGTINNCFSTGGISSNAGGMVGEDNYGYITNCYTSGLIDDNGSGITYNNMGTIVNCFTEGTGTWNDANTFDILTGTNGSTWTDADWLSDQLPYKLASFNAAIYDPATENIPASAVIQSPPGNFSTGTYSIVSINDMITTMNPSVVINSVTGEITFDNSDIGSYDVKVVYTDNADGSYQVSNYALNILSTLPVTWFSFTVMPRDKTALLQWSTASEQNTRDFEVQHSINGISWTAIGTVSAAGNSTAISNYNFLHAGPVTGNNYYRIRQSDLDGKFSYSATRMLKITNAPKSFSVLNTVVSNGVLQVEVKAPVLLCLYGNDGKLYWQKQFNAGLQNIDCSAVPPGVYFLKGKDAVEKIVVQ